MAQQEEKIHKNQQDESPKTEKSFWSKALDVAKQGFSALAGAGIGAVVGSVIPVVGTIAGAVIGAVVGRAIVEPAVKAVLDSGEKAIEDTKAPASTAQQNPNSSTVLMHDALELQPEQQQKADIFKAPKPTPGTSMKKGPSKADINKAFDQFEEIEKAAHKEPGTSLSSPFALPQLKPPGAASAA